MSGLCGNWHVFGHDGSWVASSDGHSNTTVAQVFGSSLEDIRERANAVSAVPDLLEALRDLVELVEIHDEASDPATDLYVSLKLAKLALDKAAGRL